MSSASDQASSLELAVIGNSRIAACIDARASIVWMCVPRLDGDPVFCSLLDDDAPDGRFDIALLGSVRVEQAYLRNTPILRSVMEDEAGGRIEVIDFAPRLYQHGRTFAPITIVRIVRRLAGRPRIVVRFAPRCGQGEQPAPLTFGSHHVRAAVPGYPLRLTTDASITRVIERRPLLLDGTLTFVLGPDETLQDSPHDTGRRLLEQTQGYWLRWVRNLAIPFEWQDAVIRAAISLKLNACDDTGGIVAALTTSIPEAPGSQRNWDYRFCWLRDAWFVVNALNRLGATTSMERYLQYLENVIGEAGAEALQPVYALSGDPHLHELEAPHLAGYRGMGPVRVGNQAFAQPQHDVYGAVILGVAHIFFDRRLAIVGDADLFRRLEALGEQAYRRYALPDAGIWEYRGRREIHTFSALMCWAACDRLARIAAHIGDAAAQTWTDRAAEIASAIHSRGWNAALGGYASTFDGDGVDASLLLIGEVGFLRPDDPRLRATVELIERRLRRGDFLLRYDAPDDFGPPQTAFLVCTLWWIQALALIGEHARARAEFERVLASRNTFGLLAEDIDVTTREQWGNFPQTYSMVGIITCAARLSRRWEDAF